jgi:hypothetical protein
MLKRALIVAAGTLAIAVFTTAATGPEAMAAAPKCKNKANKYVACTDKLRATPARKTAKGKQLDVESWGWGSSSASKRPRLAK